MAELAIESPLYKPPEGLMDFAERDEDGKRLILYIGNTAILDIVTLDSNAEPQFALARLESTADRAMDLFNHPALYAEEHVAWAIFERAA